MAARCSTKQGRNFLNGHASGVFASGGNNQVAGQYAGFLGAAALRHRGHPHVVAILLQSDAHPHIAAAGRVTGFIMAGGHIAGVPVVAAQHGAHQRLIGRRVLFKQGGQPSGQGVVVWRGFHSHLTNQVRHGHQVFILLPGSLLLRILLRLVGLARRIGLFRLFGLVGRHGGGGEGKQQRRRAQGRKQTFTQFHQSVLSFTRAAGRRPTGFVTSDPGRKRRRRTSRFQSLWPHSGSKRLARPAERRFLRPECG